MNSYHHDDSGINRYSLFSFHLNRLTAQLWITFRFWANKKELFGFTPFRTEKFGMISGGIS
jgi:hypothetical protein